MNNDSSKQVLPFGVVEILLPRFQEYKLKLISRRQAMLTWGKNATYVAKTAFMMRTAAQRHMHYVRQLTACRCPPAMEALHQTATHG